jgi:APA family basic amino acid/polyamine antiporter
MENKLWKVLGTGFGIAVTLGGTVGTGILRKPGPIAASLQDPSLILLLWVLVAIYALLGVSCVLELSLSIPKAGSWYGYAERAFGRYIGFLVGLTSWLGTVTALGFGSYTFSEYLILIFPALSPYLVYCAIGILALLWFFHQLGVVMAGKSQEWLSGIKAFALLIFIGICFLHGDGGVFIEHTQAPSGLPLKTGIMTALLSIFYAFDGWHTASYFTEENKEPEKSMPKAMFIGVIIVAVIYLLINVGILYSLPLETLSTSKLAAADAMKLIFGADMGRWITVFLMLSILGILNTQVMFAPRVIYSMSRDGLFFKQVEKVNAAGSPTTATHLTVFSACIFLLAGKEINERLSDIATFFFVASYLAGFSSLLKLRISEPNLRRPYLVWGYPVLPWVLVIISTLFLIGTLVTNLGSVVYVVGFVLASFLIFKTSGLENQKKNKA